MEHIAQAANRALAAASQASQLPATTSSNTVEELLEKAEKELEWMCSLPDRISDDDMRRVLAIILRPAVSLPSCPGDDFAKYMRIMEATLKARDADVMTGKVRLRAYHNRLGHHPALAIKFMAQRCVDTMIFFPAISECINILKEWQNPLDRPMFLALSINVRQGFYRFEDFREKLHIGSATQEHVDAASERWKRILFEQGYLRFDVPNNSYVIRERKDA